MMVSRCHAVVAHISGKRQVRGTLVIAKEPQEFVKAGRRNLSGRGAVNVTDCEV